MFWFSANKLFIFCVLVDTNPILLQTKGEAQVL